MKSTWRNKALICLSIIVVSACHGPQSLNQIDLAKDYGNNGLNLSYQSTFSYINDSITSVNIALNPNELLFSKNTKSEYIARYSIAYKVFKSYNDEEAIDTTEIHYSLNQKKSKRLKKNHKIKMFVPKGANYVVQLTLKDENRQQEKSKFIPLMKTNEHSESFFTINSKNNSEKGNYQKDSFNISYGLDIPKTLKVLTFKRQSVSAPKPYEVSYTFSFLGDPDSSWFVTIPSAKEAAFPPLKDGFYHFITDTINKKGFSTFHVSQEFPKTTSLSDAIGAMGYLLSKKDYARLITNQDKRMAFEWEWKKIASGKNRARNLIKQYYETINEANQLFTSYKPGWSTDRGMIYIVYGIPSVVYRYDDAEVWIYGEENNLLSEVFNFSKINSSLSPNIYELERNINYKTSWDRMVTSWKEDRGY
jgi:GWxTD domain-containing protein